MVFEKKYNLIGLIGALASVLGAEARTEPLFTIEGSIPVEISAIPDPSNDFSETKVISLMKIKPSKALKNRKSKDQEDVYNYEYENDYSSGIKSFKSSTSAVEIGMNDVPVLDQGQYGTCVTFATTAAMDAALNIGDFIDQQCSLQLNLTLGNNYWNGAYYPSQIIDPLKQYGLVQKNTCNALYPNQSVTVSLEQYGQLKDPNQTAEKLNYVYHNNIDINIVRNAIKNNHRIAIGFLIADTNAAESVQGYNFTIDNVRTTGGLWACYQPYLGGNWAYHCGYGTAGHEVIITGYDDSQKLLKIRNSWNTNVGDNGEYYMTYEFFKAMVLDGTEIY